jgi:hypothetical protein
MAGRWKDGRIMRVVIAGRLGDVRRRHGEGSARDVLIDVERTSGGSA